MAGASLTALAGNALEERADRLATASAGCRALHIDMPALSTPRLGDRAGLADELRAADIAPIELGAASRLLLKIMTTPDIPASVSVHGRVRGFASWPAGVSTSGQLAAAGLPGGAGVPRGSLRPYPGIDLITAARASLA